MQFFRNQLRPQGHIFVIGIVFLWSAGAVAQVADESQPVNAEAGVEIGAAIEPAAVEPVMPESDSGRGGNDVMPSAPDNLLVYYIKALGVTFVIVFVALSFALVALLVMCFLQLRRTVLMPPELIEGFEIHLDKKEFQQAYELAKADDSYLGRVLSVGLVKLQVGRQQAFDAMRETQAEEAMQLEHKISYVSLIGALAPMFGLLGTVSGMVSAFTVIAQSATQPKHHELASGISQALVTTLIGLWIAIPAVACFSLFRNWLEQLNSDVDTEAVRLISKVPLTQK
ncbi:MAG TPA: MotA/TolQ/ExbB proton channel family protein [Planctomycetaceae bacterium]|nr:MotA/TolQ/ExbB proton channel family protein [Planctomycetaceae bacterium]HAU49387.1 MotA/TolQ/ExbB proton channel family protein [Planctomycetaceae bacterium]|tara:strand:- start:1522 stop:2373 length:852 start_codon:yes stop_codon:yes gene_type:complete